VAGNSIGTDATGSASLPNSAGGIEIFNGSSDNTIGGTTAVAGNLITDNGGPGVVVGNTTADTSVGNQITANRIFGNTGQAIDLGDDGVTEDGTAPRQGPNNLQNFPILVMTADGQTEGWLGGSEPETTYRIDVFAGAAYGPGGSGEAQDYLGSLEVTTDASGGVSFAVPFTAPAGVPILTATATDPQGKHLGSLGPSSVYPGCGFSSHSHGGQPISGFSRPGPATESRSRTRCRSVEPGLELDAVGLRRDAGAVEYRRPDRLGRWDQVAVVQRSALGR